MSRVKVYKPTTSARRKTSVVNYAKVLTSNDPYKKLIHRQKGQAGRNSHGLITVRHQGGGYRKLVREVDFKRKFPYGFKVISVEYDPTRSAFVSLVSDLKTGEKSYVLFTKGMRPGQKYGLSKEIIEGNQLQLKELPVGTTVSQIELQPGQGAKLARSAGNYAIVTASDENMVTLKLPSGERRKVLNTCLAVVGRVGNEAKSLVRVGKAGRQRHKGIRPTVRGKVMNPTDHPHGGGEARNPVGMPYPKTPWGKHALGVKTRKPKSSDKMIISRRKSK